ncbi:RTW putative [Paraphysoderma sedebokerense]|nr:RTW putative [Paraphysoderma sedebokerense]
MNSPLDPTQPADLKIILLGDSAVGKSKLIERFLLDNYLPNTSSTYALALYRYQTSHPISNDPILIDFYDTAGQERFQSMHASYYYGAHCCLLCFDVTRKITYKNLDNWYQELKRFRPNIPVLLVANKIDQDPRMAKKTFAFAETNKLPISFVSASDGTNVVKTFKHAISVALEYKDDGSKGDFLEEVMQLLNDDTFIDGPTKEKDAAMTDNAEQSNLRIS